MHTVFARKSKSRKVWDYAIIEQHPFWAPRGTVVWGLFTSWQAPKLDEFPTLEAACKAVMGFKDVNMLLGPAGYDTYIMLDPETLEELSCPTQAQDIMGLP